MENRNRTCHSKFAILLVDGFLVAILLGLTPLTPALAAVESPPAPIAPDQKIPEQIHAAFLLAGGSSGVNKLLQTWKIRLSDEERKTKANEAKSLVIETSPPNRGTQEKVK